MPGAVSGSTQFNPKGKSQLMSLRSMKKQGVLRSVCCVLAVLGMLLLFWFGATTNAAEPKPRNNHPTFVQVEDVPGLPRVLLIGDSISMQYTFPVRELLEGKANLHRPAGNCRSTRQTLEELDFQQPGRSWARFTQARLPARVGWQPDWRHSGRDATWAQRHIG